MDKLIKNGRIITASHRYDADILVRRGKIALIGKGLDESGCEVIDASGKYVLPGGIDAHVHLETCTSSGMSADSYASGTMAAACGGVTTVFDYTLQEKGEGLIQTVEKRRAMCAPQAYVDYAFHIGISDLTPAVLDELVKTVAYGVSSFKVYMVYDFKLHDGELYKLLKRSKRAGALIAVHCENYSMIEENIKDLKAQGNTTPLYHYASRDETVEGEAVNRAIFLAKSLRAPLYIVHLACSEGVEAVTLAKSEGYKIYAETCPHYLNFTNDVYMKADGQNYICSPSIKGETSRNALWLGIRNDVIDTIATDHCPFTAEQKGRFADDFTKVPNGCMGVEIMYPFMLNYVDNTLLTYERVVGMCSANPAKIFGCDHRKGDIRIGLDGDLVIYDPSGETKISAANMHSQTDYTIYEGMSLRGRIELTMLRGKILWRDGKFLGKKGAGNFIACNKLQ